MLSWLCEQAEEEAEALVRPGGEAMTYGGLAIAVRAVGDALAQTVGDVAHLAVGVDVEDQAGFLVSALAVLTAGGVVVALDARAGDVEALARRARVVAVLRGRREEDRVEIVPGDAARVAYDARAGLILFTASPSGEPRGVVLSREGLEASVAAMLGARPVQAGARVALLSPLVRGDVLVGQALTTLRAGGTLLGLGELADPAAQLDALARLGATGLSSEPAVLRRLARRAVEAPEAPRPRLAFVASSGRLDPKAVALLREAFPGARLDHHYGLPEASPRVTTCSDAEPPFSAGSVGRALPGFTVRIVDDAGAPVPPGVEGEVTVEGPSVMLGYLNDPEGTRRARTPAGLRTGDLGRLDEAGYLYLGGRRDGLVEIGGERISPEEVTAVLRGAPGVADVCVLAVADPQDGARLVAFVQGAADAARAHARAHLPPAKQPAKVIPLESLPHDPNGRVDTQRLRRMVEVD